MILMNDLVYHYLVMTCIYPAFGYVQVAETVDSHGNMCKRCNDITENDLIAYTTTAL